jgi:hypothetical protein
MVLDKCCWNLSGLCLSPYRFQQHLSNTIMSLEYNQLVNDPCLYKKKVDDKLSILSTHVDDIMNVSNDESLTASLEQRLIEEYKEISVQNPATSYLGIDIKRGVDLRDIFLSQPELIESILAFDSDKICKTPSTSDIYKQDGDDQSINQKKYLSIIMKMMYLARITRPDLLFSVTHLASRCSSPTVYDYKQVIRIIRYIRYTRHYVLHIHCDNLSTYLNSDASYASHSDGRSQTGFVLCIGTSYIHAVSLKQKVGSSSSTDAEIIALQSSVKYLKWIRQVLYELDVEDVKPTIAYQDNKSTILICSANSSSTKRVKHLLSKISFIRSMIQSNEVIIQYLETEETLADIFTKPLPAQNHQKLSQHLGIIDAQSL